MCGPSYFCDRATHHFLMVALRPSTLLRAALPLQRAVPACARALSTSYAAASPEFTIAGQSRPGRAVYLDSQATTPLDPRALDAMMPYMTGMFGNPHSVTHAYGWEASEVVDTAREQVASLVGADSKEIVFTSGATESNNMAIKGVAHFYSPKKKHVITTVTEHKCVLDSCRSLQQEGFDITYLPVKSDGLVDMAELEAAIRPDTALVSVMMVNNEIGVVQPIAEIGALCRSKKVFFHVDAAQAVGKIPVDVEALKIDLMSMSAHKLYGPKGIGALYVRRRPRVRLEPVFSGGGQERGFRSGTLPHPLVAGFGAACEIAGREMERDLAHVKRLHKKLYDNLVTAIPNVEVNGSIEHRYPGNLNISFSCAPHRTPVIARSAHSTRARASHASQRRTMHAPPVPLRACLLPTPHLPSTPQVRRRGEPPHGHQRHCRLLRLCLYLRIPRTVVRPAR